MDDDVIRGLARSQPWRPRAFSPALPRRHFRRVAPALWLIAERIARHGGWLAFFVLVAPILGPHDFGLFVLAISGIAVVESVLSDMAVQALVNLDAVDEQHLSTAFLTTTGAGAAVSAMLYAAAGGISAMFDDRALGDLFQSLSLLPLLSALTAVPAAMLRRRRSAAPLAASTAAGMVAGGAVGVALARAGAGAWSLVAQIIIQRFFEIAILWGVAGRRIGLSWSRRHFAELAGALDLAALCPVMAEMSRQMPRLLIGIVLGPTAAGLYLIASRLFEGLCDIVLAPLVSGARPAALVRRATRIALPAAIGGAALLPIVLPALLDPRWWGAVPPAQILLLAAIPAGVIHLRRAALMVGGKRASEPRFEIGMALSGVIAAALAVPYGLGAVAGMVAIHAAVAALASPQADRPCVRCRVAQRRGGRGAADRRRFPHRRGAVCAGAERQLASDAVSGGSPAARPWRLRLRRLAGGSAGRPTARALGIRRAAPG